MSEDMTAEELLDCLYYAFEGMWAANYGTDKAKEKQAYTQLVKIVEQQKEDSEKDMVAFHDFEVRNDSNDNSEAKGVDEEAIVQGLYRHIKSQEDNFVTVVIEEHHMEKVIRDAVKDLKQLLSQPQKKVTREWAEAIELESEIWHILFDNKKWLKKATYQEVYNEHLSDISREIVEKLIALSEKELGVEVVE